MPDAHRYPPCDVFAPAPGNYRFDFYPPHACYLQLPYEQQTDGEDALSSITLNAAVSTIRKEVEADLVHLIGLLPDYCGIS